MGWTSDDIARLIEEKERPITNYDRIVGKSIEELAKWCNDFNFNCPPVDCCENGCEVCWLEWLKREVDDGLDE